MCDNCQRHAIRLIGAAFVANATRADTTPEDAGLSDRIAMVLSKVEPPAPDFTGDRMQFAMRTFEEVAKLVEGFSTTDLVAAGQMCDDLEDTFHALARMLLHFIAERGELGDADAAGAYRRVTIEMAAMVDAGESRERSTPRRPRRQGGPLPH